MLFRLLNISLSSPPPSLLNLLQPQLIARRFRLAREDWIASRPWLHNWSSYFHILLPQQQQQQQQLPNTQFPGLPGGGGRLEKALHRLGSQSTPVLQNELLSLLKFCCEQKSLHLARCIYMWCVVLHDGEEFPVPLGAHLVVALSRCGALEDALHNFSKLPCRTAFSWTAIISGFLNRGSAHVSLQLYVSMQDDGVKADRYTFVALFKACGDMAELELGRMLHAEARRRGFAADIFSATTLISMYGKCGALEEAENVFAGIYCGKDTVSWNAMLSAYLEQDEGERALTLYAHMRALGMKHNKESSVIALRACIVFLEKDAEEEAVRYVVLRIVQALHRTDLQRSGFIRDTVAGSALIHAYSKCDALQEAEEIFYDLLRPDDDDDVVPWTAMLSAYVEHHEGETALQLYAEIRKRGMRPNVQTVVSALQACCDLARDCKESEMVVALEVGRAIHADTRKVGLVSNDFVRNALINMYRNCMAVADAGNLSCGGDGASKCDVVFWTSLISLHVEQGHGEMALHLYRLMHTEGVSPNHHTIVASLQACSILAKHHKSRCLKEGRDLLLGVVNALHSEVQKKGIHQDIFVTSALVKAYGKCGDLVGAERAFESSIEFFSIVAWNAMLSTYIEQGQELMALQLYGQMRRNGALMDVCTLVCGLQGSSEAGNSEICKKLHFDILCAGLDVDSVLTSCLLCAYGSSRAIDDAEAVAYASPKLDVVSWNSCINGISKQGEREGIIQIFEQMRLQGNVPTESSFTSLLSACSHAGLIDQGVWHFQYMRSVYHIAPELKHYINLVDLLGRAGAFRRAGNVLANMPMQPDASLYLCLLGACFIHGNSELGRLAFSRLLNTCCPDHVSAYVLLSNMGLHIKLQACEDESLEGFALEEGYS